MTWSNYTQGRDNDFNLIRIVAALAVLVTQSFALAIWTGGMLLLVGRDVSKPPSDLPGMNGY